MIYLIAEDIRSALNVGALFRCADVFGVSKVFLTGYTPKPPRAKIKKTALGAETWVPWEHHLDPVKLIEQLKKQGIEVVALETSRDAIPLPSFHPRGPVCLVVGNEVEGITRSTLKAVDRVVRIPMVGRKESLNVAVAAGVALYALSQSR